jgi:anti-sigma B factor antagonist
VILDLSRVSFCDSSGIGALMQIYATFKREHRRLALAGISDRVRNTLGIAKVLSLFDVFATADDAEETLS